MGKLKVIQTSPLATVQDKGRFGFRKYGIPQSGVIDPEGMRIANQLVSNEHDAPLIEYALGGIKLEALENTTIGVFGAALKLNGRSKRENAISVNLGDLIELSAPILVYAYLAIGGKLTAENAFDSYSTYVPGKFGGLAGRSLQKGDILHSDGNGLPQNVSPISSPDNFIRFMKGPEWNSLVEPFEKMAFQINPSSNRIGIRLSGQKLGCTINEIKSSAVVPGIIQLPPNGHPIVLMNDCQTTGGYPRIGKVLDEDLGKLGQIKVEKQVTLMLID